MKKLLTLLLVLLLSVGLAVPALAFTSDTSEKEDHPYDLSIYLVEYEDNDLFGFATLPPSDRGYAKNEIVAAVVELFVPEDEEITTDEYGTLVFGGDNVDLDVKDNYNAAGDIDLLDKIQAGSSIVVESDLNDDEIVFHITKLDGDYTYKWLFFAKVTDDDASLYAKLIDGNGVVKPPESEHQTIDLTLSGVNYRVRKYGPDPDDNYQYGIFILSGDYEYAGIYLDVDKDDKTIGMIINPTGGHFEKDYFALGVNTKNELGIVDPDNPAKILTEGDDFDDVMDVYNDVVVDVFGFDYFKIGNYLRYSYFEDLVSGDTIIATVDIKPFTPYVTVPDVVVVDPPKTGDAASIMGVVMVALSFAGTAMLKKRG